MMTKEQYADELVRLLNEGLKALQEGRIADKCRLFARHDDMTNHPEKYIAE